MPSNGGPRPSGAASSTRSFGSDDEGDAVRKSQRQPQSCTECTRRKTRCDKQTPCANCVKRGKVSECRVEITVKPVTISTRSVAHNAQEDIDRLRQSTTQTANQHENRISMLENMVAQLATQLAEVRNGGGSFQSTVPGEMGKIEGPTTTRIGGSPSGSADGGMVDTEAEAASTLEFLAMGRSRAKTTGALVGGTTRRSSDDEEEMEHWNGDGDQRDSQPHHASTSRRRLSNASSSSSVSGSSSTSSAREQVASNHGGASYPLMFDSPPAQGTQTPPTSGRQVSAFPHPLSNSHQPPQSATRPTLTSRQSNGVSGSSKRGAMSRLPDEQAGRALIAYEIDQVAWIHAAYHRATFAAECALFWEEGASGEVEVNKNWLSLFFAVLSSALHHIPLAEAQRLFPGENIQGLILRYFDASLLALNEANWMETHSLYSTQTILVLCSPANHLGRSDWYLSALAVGIRIAQALNINNLGKDTYPAAEGAVLPPMDPNALILREMCKRIWYQLVIQDWFHLPFNRTSVISANQFNSAVPLHCTDESLLAPSTLVPLSVEIPTFDSHTTQLLKLALQIHKLFDGLHVTKTVAYSLVLSMDAEVSAILKKGPSWMQLDANGRPNPLPKHPPTWLDWSRMTFLVSAAHKIIILHRPFLGRAFTSGDATYKKSRDTCVLHARRILQFLRDCPLEEFRKTWTNLTHSVAAAVILILEVSHTQGTPAQDDEPLQLVLSAIEIFRSLSTQSAIAEKGVRVLEQLLKDSAKGPGHLKRKATDGGGRTEVELERAIKALRRKPSNLAGSSVSSASPPAVPTGAVERSQPGQQQQPATHPAHAFHPPPQHAQPLSFAPPSQHLPYPYANHPPTHFAPTSAHASPTSYHAPPPQHHHQHIGPFGMAGLQQQGGSGAWSPHPYGHFAGGGQIGGGVGGYENLFEGLGEFELSGLLEYGQQTGGGGAGEPGVGGMI